MNKSFLILAIAFLSVSGTSWAQSQKLGFPNFGDLIGFPPSLGGETKRVKTVVV